MIQMLVTTLLAVAAPLLHAAGVRAGYYGVQGGYWWFDHLTHFVSGAAVTALFLLALEPWAALLAFATATTVWEIAEYLKGSPEEMWISVRNMTYDLVFGGAAAMLVVLVFG